MERKTRIWIGLGTALLVGSAGIERVALARETSYDSSSDIDALAMPAPQRQRLLVAQADAAGEGGPGEGGGPVLGTITEFRLSTTGGETAFAYDATSQVSDYATLVYDAYAAALASGKELRAAVDTLIATPTTEALQAARSAWSKTRDSYLKTEAFLNYAGPVDGPGGPFPRLNFWPIKPALIDELLEDPAQSLNFRALARLNKIEPPVKVTVGLHVAEYLLWGADGTLAAEAFAGDAGKRRGEYLEAVSQLYNNDMGVLAAAWATGANNYRASVKSMDKRNALGRAFNGMAALVGYELPLRRLGAGLFPANENFQPSPFSGTSEQDNTASFVGARAVYFDTGIDKLVAAADPELAAQVEAGFDRAGAALAALDAPYARFLAPAAGSAERQAAEAAVKALTDLARDLRIAGNRLGVLVVVPGM